MLGGLGAGLGILGQAAFLTSCVRKRLSKIGHIEGMLFKEEGKGWEAAWKDNKALAKWTEHT